MCSSTLKKVSFVHEHGFLHLYTAEHLLLSEASHWILFFKAENRIKCCHGIYNFRA